jgi:hypothetical protein
MLHTAIQPGRLHDRGRELFIRDWIAHERLQVGVEMAFRRVFDFLGERVEIGVLLRCRPVDAEARALGRLHGSPFLTPHSSWGLALTAWGPQAPTYSTGYLLLCDL